MKQENASLRRKNPGAEGEKLRTTRLSCGEDGGPGCRARRASTGRPFHHQTDGAFPVKPTKTGDSQSRYHQAALYSTCKMGKRRSDGLAESRRGLEGQQVSRSPFPSLSGQLALWRLTLRRIGVSDMEGWSTKPWTTRPVDEAIVVRSSLHLRREGSEKSPTTAIGCVTEKRDENMEVER